MRYEFQIRRKEVTSCLLLLKNSFLLVAAHRFQRHTDFSCEPRETLLDKTTAWEFLKTHFEQQTFSYPGIFHRQTWIPSHKNDGFNVCLGQERTLLKGAGDSLSPGAWQPGLQKRSYTAGRRRCQKVRETNCPASQSAYLRHCFGQSKEL